MATAAQVSSLTPWRSYAGSVTTDETEATVVVPPTPGRLLKRGATALVVTVLANQVVRAVGIAAVPALDDVGPLGVAPVLASSMIAGLGASAVYALLTRVSPTPDATFRRIAAGVLALSLVPLLAVAPGIDGMTPGGVAVLGAMHGVSAAGIVAVLTGAVDW